MAISPAPATPDLSNPFTAIPNGQSYVDGMVNHYILRTKSTQGIAGFVFDYLGDTTLNLEADITDHYSENNFAVQDHVAIKPTRVVLKGFVSELVHKAPQGVVGLLASMQSGLSQIDAYLESYTPGVVQTLQKAVTQVQNTVNNINNTLQKAQNVISLFPGAPPTTTKQETAYIQLSIALRTKQVMTIETPFHVFDNMIIERLTLIQPEETKTWADISVTLKQLRFVDVTLVADDGTFANRLAQQRAAATNKGTVPGAPVNQSVAYSLAKTAGWIPH